MKQITLETKEREGAGSGASRRLRASGEFPAVIYGESGVRHLAVNAHAFQMQYRQIAGSAALIELKVAGEGEATFAIIQEIQRCTKSDQILHVDFKEIVRGRDMEADIPVHAKGISHGVKNFGGVLEISLEEMRVRCRPRNLPEAIEVDVTDLHIGRSLHVRDIVAPEGVTLLEDPDQVVVACVGSSGGASAAAEEADAAE